MDPFRTGSRTVPCKQKAYPIRSLDRNRLDPFGTGPVSTEPSSAVETDFLMLPFLPYLMPIMISFHENVNENENRFLTLFYRDRRSKIRNLGQYIDVMQARSINLPKKNETNIFPVWIEQASSKKFLLLWLYFEFPDGTAHFIGDKACASIRRENLFLLRRFRRISTKIFGQTTTEKKGST